MDARLPRQPAGGRVAEVTGRFGFLELPAELHEAIVTLAARRVYEESVGLVDSVNSDAFGGRSVRQEDPVAGRDGDRRLHRPRRRPRPVSLRGQATIAGRPGVTPGLGADRCSTRRRSSPSARRSKLTRDAVRDASPVGPGRGGKHLRDQYRYSVTGPATATWRGCAAPRTGGTAASSRTAATPGFSRGRHYPAARREPVRRARRARGQSRRCRRSSRRAGRAPPRGSRRRSGLDADASDPRPALEALVAIEERFLDAFPDTRIWPLQPARGRRRTASGTGSMPDPSESRWMGTGPTHEDTIVIRATSRCATPPTSRQMWELLRRADAFLT
jgi:hypothetical protein